VLPKNFALLLLSVMPHKHIDKVPVPVSLLQNNFKRLDWSFTQIWVSTWPVVTKTTKLAFRTD